MADGKFIVGADGQFRVRAGGAFDTCEECCADCGTARDAIDLTLAGIDASVCGDCVNIGADGWKMIALAMDGTYTLTRTGLSGGIATYEAVIEAPGLGSMEIWQWLGGVCFALLETIEFDRLRLQVNMACEELDEDGNPQVTQINVIADRDSSAFPVEVLAYNAIFDAGAPRHHNDTIANNDGAGGVACGVMTSVGISQSSFGVSGGTAETSDP